MLIDFTGQQVGNYHLLRRLGVGGSASVYQGQHVRIATQHAAIKILHLIDIDVQRFQQEAETTAALVHPNIIRLFDFDIAKIPSFDQVPFLVLDYAPGGSLRMRHSRGSHLSLVTVAEYVKVLAGALQFAHDQNIIHRDIKPDNVLIGPQGELRLSDFGIAVLSQTGRTTLNPAYGPGGTPFYMAPEQCRGKPEKASDQYALAIMAYEWLSGSPPFTEGNALSIQFQHVSEPVPPLREKLPMLPEAVEQVILTALAKDPGQRYDSVQAFAQTLEQAVALPQSQVTFVGKPTPLSRTTLVGMPALLSRTTLVGIPVIQSKTALATVPVPQSPGVRLFQYTGHPDWVHAVAWSPDGKRIASAGRDKTVQVWSIDGSERPFTYTGHSEAVRSVAWSPDGKRIASGSDDRTVQVWNADGSGRPFTCTGHEDTICSVAWSPDGKCVASASRDKCVWAWDAEGRGLLFKYTGHSEAVWSVAWSPDGKRIASGSDDKTVQVWSADGGGQPFVYTSHSGVMRSVAWSPDGQRIASACADKAVQVWNADGSGQPFAYTGHSAFVMAVAWSPDGNRIVSASADKTVRVWVTDGNERYFVYTGHSRAVTSVAWSPDGKYIASASDDKTVQVWSAG